LKEAIGRELGGYTYATLMLQKKAPIDWLLKRIGHWNLTMADPSLLALDQFRAS
jgi:hypothetical protein